MGGRPYIGISVKGATGHVMWTNTAHLSSLAAAPNRPTCLGLQTLHCRANVARLVLPTLQ
jgi:hypothetical protein